MSSEAELPADVKEKLRNRRKSNVMKGTEQEGVKLKRRPSEQFGKANGNEEEQTEPAKPNVGNKQQKPPKQPAKESILEETEPSDPKEKGNQSKEGEVGEKNAPPTTTTPPRSEEVATPVGPVGPVVPVGPVGGNKEPLPAEVSALRRGSADVGGGSPLLSQTPVAQQPSMLPTSAASTKSAVIDPILCPDVRNLFIKVMFTGMLLMSLLVLGVCLLESGSLRGKEEIHSFTIKNENSGQIAKSQKLFKHLGPLSQSHFEFIIFRVYVACKPFCKMRVI